MADYADSSNERIYFFDETDCYPSCFCGRVAAAQTPTISAAVNVVTFQPVLCPGLDVAIYGSSFGTGPTSSVTIDVAGEPGFVTAVSPNQVNAQLPVNAPTGPVTITLTVNGVTSPPFNITLAAYAPTFFAQSSTTGGMGAGLFLTSTGAAITTAAPAQPGEVITAYLIGLGPTNPMTPTGTTGALNKTATTPVLTVGTTSAIILYAGTSPYAGLYQVNFQVPGTASGVEPVSISIGGATSPFPVTLAVVGATAPAIGSIDTPANDTTGITGAISVTGWGLSWAGVQTIAMWRAPVTGEKPSSNGLVFLANTALVPMSRPDVALSHPGYPGNNSGFGGQILTNELPNSSGAPERRQRNLHHSCAGKLIPRAERN